MFDIAWSELALIGAVALIVIGPKDLPRVMRSLGRWTRRARAMAAEFQRNFDDMMREAELHELRKEVESVTPASVTQKVEAMVDLDGMKQAMKIEPPVSPPTASEPIGAEAEAKKPDAVPAPESEPERKP